MAIAKPNINAVAKKAGVAKSTVSRFLNGGSISEKTRTHLAGIIKQLGYRPLVSAQNFSRRRAGSLGLVVESSGNEWCGQILMGIEEICTAQRTSVVISNLVVKERYDANMTRDLILDHRVDGLIFGRAALREKELVDLAVSHGVPIALIGPDTDFGAGLVIRADNVRAGELVGTHLLSLGHKRIAFVGGPRESVDTQDRLRGLRKALAKQGITLPTSDIHFMIYDREAGRSYATKWLGVSPVSRPSAVVLGNDEMALAFMRHVQEKGINVPKQVSVVGFDDIPNSGTHWPGLTTVSVPIHDMAAEASRWLLQPGSEREATATARHDFAVTLVVRESTGRFA